MDFTNKQQRHTSGEKMQPYPKLLISTKNLGNLRSRKVSC